MNDTRRWILLGAVVAGAFGVLGFFGAEVYRQAPPIPDRVVAADDGAVLMTEDDILTGQQVWQSIGGQQVGSIWGHGAYQAPDWSADWLHREATALLDLWAEREAGTPFDALDPERRAALKERLRGTLRTNTHDPESGAVTVSADRVAAIERTRAHYMALFGDDPALVELRDHYAIQDDAVPDEVRRARMCDFFFWTAWACVTERPGTAVTYTNNWPHEELVGNAPTGANVTWSVVSLLFLLGGIGALVWWKAVKDRHEGTVEPPARDPIGSFELTPSMRALGWYCAVVLGLFLVQCLLGALTAHYTVEGRALFGLPLGDLLPYSLTRTWHIQTGVFWIATAFLAAGLFLAPIVGGREPRFQRLGVHVLFGALLVVVVGSMAGEWLAIRQVLDLDLSFWFGHQGYEYVDLGRAWQIALIVGLVLWLVLMLRGLWPALTTRPEATADGEPRSRSLLALFAGSTVAIGLFYGAGLLYGARTHLSVAEYWRWWVVHLWVEGFFEVFATAAIAFLFAYLGLVKRSSATRAALFSTAIFLAAGIPGTFHHLYFSGTPVSIMAIGASFSALEVVPLVLIGFEAVETLRLGRKAPWMRAYRWPIRFFVGVAFWNLVGAGLFGFLINPPIALYYMQGLNTTPVHGHTALFGVYGLLSLGLVLLILRRLTGSRPWRERPLAWSFWLMNGGLTLMVALSLLPIGILQTVASVDHGLWFARSADFLQLPHLKVLRWLRLVGDTVFLAGVVTLVWWAIGLRSGRSLAPEPTAPSPSRPPAPAAREPAGVA
ncbi:MAG: nitric-oxide reductase large subunit [Planctomycetota bacterium JB042]